MWGFFICTHSIMISFSPCKINLGLRITAKRIDGYHDLDTVFYPLALYDALEFIEANEMKFSSSSIPIPIVGKNIVIAAYDLVKSDYPNIPALHIHLHKQIPIGAGLGGGSGNAVTMLKMLNTYYNLNLSEEKLFQYALQLGSDCPFFLHETACEASGRGEVLNSIALDLSDYQIVLVYPDLHVSTASAFSAIQPQQLQLSCSEIVKQPIETWRDLLVNDFEVPLFNSYPILAEIKRKLYELGASYAAMSGSGSALYGLFKHHQVLDKKKLSREELLVDKQIFYIGPAV